MNWIVVHGHFFFRTLRALKGIGFAFV
jgi:hypothetical protein